MVVNARVLLHKRNGIQVEIGRLLLNPDDIAFIKTLRTGNPYKYLDNIYHFFGTAGDQDNPIDSIILTELPAFKWTVYIHSGGGAYAKRGEMFLEGVPAQGEDIEFEGAIYTFTSFYPHAGNEKCVYLEPKL